jgi:hypothetical protein
MNDLAALETEFKDIVAKNIHRDGIDLLMSWIGTTDFYSAPSSTRYHGSEPGGLVAHSIAVYKHLKAKQTDEDDETIAIAALFHDLCKCNFYKQSFRNVKNEVTGKWERVPCYEIDDQLCLGHGEKSMFIIMNFMKLTDDECLAIRWHMGFSAVEQQFEKPALTKAMQQCKLVIKLIESDMEAAFWDGK